MKQIFISPVCCLCYGSKRALEKTKEILGKTQKVVLFKELLHNEKTTAELKKLGAVQKDDISEIKKGDVVIIRAHGEPKSTYEYFEGKGIEYVDCTCPNVMAINKLVEMKNAEGYKIIIVGKYGKGERPMHPEVAGTAGWCKDPIFIEDLNEVENLDLSFEKYYLVVQTTFSSALADEIIAKTKAVMETRGKAFDYKKTTCSAQQMINIKSVELAKQVDAMIVVGGKKSSNTKELFLNVSQYVKTYFAQNAEEVTAIKNEFDKYEKIGLTGGASTCLEDLEEIKGVLSGGESVCKN